MPAEPSITVNGCELSDEQAKVVRLAVDAFFYTLSDPMSIVWLGRETRAAYDDRIREVASIIFMGG